jgi:hypothetical protein
MNRAETELEQALEESRRRASPEAADRARISQLLRAQLRAAALDADTTGSDTRPAVTRRSVTGRARARCRNRRACRFTRRRAAELGSPPSQAREY